MQVQSHSRPRVVPHPPRFPYSAEAKSKESICAFAMGLSVGTCLYMLVCLIAPQPAKERNGLGGRRERDSLCSVVLLCVLSTLGGTIMIFFVVIAAYNVQGRPAWTTGGAVHHPSTARRARDE